MRGGKDSHNRSFCDSIHLLLIQLFMIHRTAVSLKPALIFHTGAFRLAAYGSYNFLLH